MHALFLFNFWHFQLRDMPNQLVLTVAWIKQKGCESILTPHLHDPKPPHNRPQSALRAESFVVDCGLKSVLPEQSPCGQPFPGRFGFCFGALSLSHRILGTVFPKDLLPEQVEYAGEVVGQGHEAPLSPNFL